METNVLAKFRIKSKHQPTLTCLEKTFMGTDKKFAIKLPERA